MRNLKKLLALTLAMVMAFSMMLTASAAVKYDDYQDKDSITAEFTEAVQVLTGLEVMQGDEKDGVKGFRPSDKITRAEAAAVIYRAVTGDVTNKQNDLYKDYGTFTDVKSDDWFAGYVGYCQNAGYIKGTTPTTFNPYGQVTGYEVLAMILRAVGYGKNDEFTGSSWQVNVAALARQLGVTRNVTAAHMEQTLNMAAPREVVADLVFMTIATVPTVTYTPALAYNDKQSIAGSDSTIYNVTLGQQVFGLFHDTAWQVIDRWGNPGYRWYKNGAWNGTTVTRVSDGKGYMVPANHPVYIASTTVRSTVATIAQIPDYETTEQVHECDVAAALGFGDDELFKLYVNGDNDLRTAAAGVNPITTTYKVVATDTTTKVGGQGRLTKFYYEMENPWFTDDAGTNDMVATMVDTMLAKVTGKADAKLDAADHVITPAKLDVTIWDGAQKSAEESDTNAVSIRTISKPSNSKENWTDYSVGDYILINAYTDKATAKAHNTAATLEEAAFETNKVIGDSTAGYTGDTLVQGTTAWVLQKSDSVTGKQTTIYWNQNKHAVDGQGDLNDQLTLFLDKAGTTTGTTYRWFKDQYGNLIGIGDAGSVNFGVITSIYAAYGQGETDTDGTAKAIATVRYADGSTGTLTINRFLASHNGTVENGRWNQAYTVAYSSTEPAVRGTDVLNGAAGANTVDLRPVYDTQGHAPLSASTNGTSGDKRAEDGGLLWMAPVAATNANSHNGVGVDHPSDVYGILYDNMWKFEAADDNSVVAIEVAGGVNASTNQPVTNSGAWNGLAHLKVNDTNGGMLYKSSGWLTTNVNNGYDANTNVWADNETMILVRNNANGVTAYTLDTLPGNVTLYENSEVDWADTDGDGRAEYLYVRGSIEGVVTYGLFYYGGGAAQWSANGGTIAGYLNGEATTVTFPAGMKAGFDAIAQSYGTYAAHLFALQMTNGAVSSVMTGHSVKDITTDDIYLLGDDAGVSTDNDKFGDTGSAYSIKQIQTPGGVKFEPGANNAKWGNPYTDYTGAMFLDDSRMSSTATVSYVRDNQGNKIVYENTASPATKSTYYLSPNCKVIGDLDWLNMTDRTNYVTIVMENANSFGSTFGAVVTEIYIDSNITPNPGTTTWALNLESMRVVHNTTTNTMDLAIHVYVQNWNGFNPNVIDGATVTLRNVNTDSMILRGTPVTNGVAGGVITDDSAWGSGKTGHYVITVPGAGATLSSAAGQSYDSTVTLTLSDNVTGTAHTFIGTFTNHGIL